MLVSNRVKCVVLSTLLVLSACGGGGGGSGGNAGTGGTAPPAQPPAPAPVALPPLVLSETDTYRLPSEALTTSNAVLAAGQFVVDTAKRFQVKGVPLSQKVSCYDQREMTVTLTDADGNGVASAGDRLSVQANGCRLGVPGNPPGLVLTVDLHAGTLLAEGKLAALVQIDDGVNPPPDVLRLGGSFMFNWEDTTLGQSWRVSASSKDDLATIAQNGSRSFLRAPVMAKTVDYVTARAQVSLAMRYESGAGSVLVSTPVPLSSGLNHDAEQGTVEFRGANGVVRVTTERQVSYGLAIADLLLGNSPTPVKTEKYAWLGWTGGFLWWDGYRRDYAWNPDFNVQDFGFSRYLSVADPARVSSADAVFRLQFTAPPADLPQLFYRFEDVTRDEPRLGYYPPTLPNVPATAEVHGALVLLRPAQALGPGRTWALMASRDGVTWNEPGKPAPDIVVSDANGHPQVVYNGYMGKFQTPNTPQD
jgi:hypothetical protein